MKEFIDTEIASKQQKEQHATCDRSPLLCVTPRISLPSSRHRLHRRKMQHDMRSHCFPRGSTPPPPKHIHKIEWEILGTDRTIPEPNRKVNSKSLVQNSQESLKTRSYIHYKTTQISYRLSYL